LLRRDADGDDGREPGSLLPEDGTDEATLVEGARRPPRRAWSGASRARGRERGHGMHCGEIGSGKSGTSMEVR
jgi:hypothetical protein